MLFFRADANSQIGSGHVMRCIAIANAARERGIESTFIVADEESKVIIDNYQYPTICLGSTWNQLNDEIDKLTLFIKDLQINQIFVDSYYVTDEYLSKLKEQTKTIYLDDINSFLYPVDVLINYNIYAKNYNYNDRYKNIKLLIGCEYVPLRKEFQEQHYTVRNKVQNILITTGGTDSFNMTTKLLDLLLNEKQYYNIIFHVVVGNFNVHVEELMNIELKHTNLKLYKNVKNISNLMKVCDLAIAAGGTTLYELAACGIPSISFSQADNQLDGVKEFHNQNIIYYVGDIRENILKCIQKIDAITRELIDNKEMRHEMSLRMKKVVDGFGADRIIDHLI